MGTARRLARDQRLGPRRGGPGLAVQRDVESPVVALDPRPEVARLGAELAAALLRGERALAPGRSRLHRAARPPGGEQQGGQAFHAVTVRMASSISASVSRRFDFFARSKIRFTTSSVAGFPRLSSQ